MPPTVPHGGPVPMSLDRLNDPARIRRYARPKSVRQVIGETLCAITGHRPRERKPISHYLTWNGLICGRCGRYPVLRKVNR